MTLVLSSVKNISAWSLYETHNDNFYHFPVFDFLGKIHPIVDYTILFASLISLWCLKSKNNRIYSVPFFINGCANLYFMAADYLQLHHDMLLSGMIFISYGLIYYYKNTKKEYGYFLILIAIVASTYLLSGVAKINSDFLSGEITATIIGRSEQFFFWPIMAPFQNFAVELSYFAMIVEIIEPIILIGAIGTVKLYLILLAFPFHLGILLTNTGTVYNLIYPACFLFIVAQQYPSLNTNKNFISRIYKLALMSFQSFAILYVALLPLLLTTNLMHKYLGYGLKSLFL